MPADNDFEVQDTSSDLDALYDLMQEDINSETNEEPSEDEIALKDFMDKDDSEILDDDIDKLYNMLNNKKILDTLSDDNTDGLVPNDLNDNEADSKSILNKEDNELLDDDINDLYNMLNESETLDISQGLEDQDIFTPQNNMAAEEKNIPMEPEPDDISENLLSSEQEAEMEALLKGNLSFGMSDDEIDKMLAETSNTQKSILENHDDDPLVKSYTTYEGLTEEEKLAKAIRTRELEKKASTRRLKEDVKKENKIAVMLKKFFSSVNERTQKIPILFLLVPLGVLSLIVITLGTLITIHKFKINKILEEGNTVVVKQPEYLSNDSNYIFVLKSQPFEDGQLQLTRMLLDSEATKFYFDTYFDARQYDITLTDKRNKLYNMDLTYIFTEEEFIQNNSSSTVLWFDPIDKDITEILLTLRNTSTNEKTEFRLMLERKATEKPARYLTERLNVETGDPSMRLSIENATFSSSGSTINYKITLESEDDSVYIPKADLGTVKPIVLEEGGRTILPQRVSPIQYTFNDKVIIGRMDFNSVKDLNSTVKVKFQNLYKKINMNDELLATPLFENTKESEISINVRPYRLVLERMGATNDRYILVYHVEDLRIRPDDIQQESEGGVLGVSDISQPRPPLATRIEGKLEVQLIARNENGMEIVLDGVCRSRREGGDVTFSTEKVAEMVDSLGADSLYLNINNLLVSMDTFEVPINLSRQAGLRNESEISRANSVIEHSFRDRLGVKSKTVNEINLEGLFVPSLISDPYLSQEYEPLTTDDPAQYNARVLTSGMTNDNNNIFALVQETWKGIIGGIEHSYYRTHKVIAERTEDSWIIKEDVILK